MTFHAEIFSSVITKIFCSEQVEHANDRVSIRTSPTWDNRSISHQGVILVAKTQTGMFVGGNPEETHIDTEKTL